MGQCHFSLFTGREMEAVESSDSRASHSSSRAGGPGVLLSGAFALIPGFSCLLREMKVHPDCSCTGSSSQVWDGP